MEEIWRDIDGYEGLYQVSNLGNVKSLNYRGQRGCEHLITPKRNNDGRLWVILYKSRTTKPMLIHRLVAMAFIPNPNNFPQINHKDENPKNNRADNLEWCTLKYNLMYTYQRHPEKYHNVTEENFGTQHRYFNHSKSRTNGKRKDLVVEQLTKEGTLVKRWENSRTIFVQTGMSDWSVSQCCRGKRKTAYGFRWQYAI